MTDCNPDSTRHELRTVMACGSKPGQASQEDDPRISQDLPPVTGDPVPRPMPYEPHDPRPESGPAEPPVQPTGDAMYLL